MMGDTLHKIRDMVCDGLDGIAARGQLDAASLDTADKLAHTLKSIDTVMAMGNAPESRQSALASKLRAMMGEASTDAERAALEACIGQMGG